MAGGGGWRIVAALAVLGSLSFLATRAVDAQPAGNYCADTSLNNCVVNAYCYDTPGFYICQCPQNYYGDGHANGSGCTLRRLAVWRIIVSTIMSVVGAILIFYICLSFLRRRQHQQVAYPVQPMANPAVYGYPPQGIPMPTMGNPPAGYPYPPQGAPPVYPPQGAAPAYSNKVPGPAGVV